MTLGFKSVILGNTEYGNTNGTKLSISKTALSSIPIVKTIRKGQVSLFEIDCADSLVKVGTELNATWQLLYSYFKAHMVFTEAIDSPFNNEAIQSDSFTIDTYPAIGLILTSRCANTMFGLTDEDTVAHPVIAINFTGSSPSSLLYLSQLNINNQTGIEITADDIKKDGVSIIGGGSGHPEATDADMDYNNPSSEYLVMTPAQVKAMIDAALGGGSHLPDALNLTTSYKLTRDDNTNGDQS